MALTNPLWNLQTSVWMTVLLDHLRVEGLPLAGHEARLGDLALTVLVGVTGVGKSTALNALGSGTRILPDRREITDAVMILPLAGHAVTDREERFHLTAKYREQHLGGMAEALGSLVADTHFWGKHPVFDGLRGLDEVRYATQTFPDWRFIALGASDVVRVQRLLGRADQFDKVSSITDLDHSDLLAALKALQADQEVFSDVELQHIAEFTNEGHSAADILAKTKIVLTERLNYDPTAADMFLATLPPERALRLDTVDLSPEEVAQTIRKWI